MKRQKNNNRVIKIVVPVIICLVAALVVAGYFLFRVNNISYEGNRHYSDEEMNNYIFGTDTPNAVVYNIFGKKNKQIPFIQKYEVETIWPDKMNVTIYEKAVVGYINYMGCNMYFDKDGTDTIVHAGHMVLYRPKEPQKYVYYAKDHTEVYWVHFTGSSVTNLLRSYGITKDKRVFYCGSDPEYKNLFSVMIKELQMCKSGYSEMLEMYLRQIFIRLQRHFEQTIMTDTSQIAEEIDKAIVYFSEHYNEAINVDAYAKQNHVSTNWFIRNFKMYTGTTPKQFILQKRINNAETLLQNKQYNIKEIAQIIGYDNPLYFSRIFQRTKGISPSEYRKNI